MKNNRSLAISTIINEELKNKVTLSFMSDHVPDELFKKGQSPKSRDRVFTQKNTLEAMLLTSTLEDKSLKNAVTQFYVVHQRKRAIMEEELKRQIEAEKKGEKNKTTLRGRPKKFELKMPKSKVSDISLNTAGYSKARKRLPVQLTVSLFEASKIAGAENDYSHWHGLKVLEADGTYLQLQDTPEIRNEYPVKNDNEGGYPQALLETITERGTGQVVDYRLSSRAVSELALIHEILDDITHGHILLMDDLYNCYEILSKCIMKNIHFVVPSKRKRNYKVIRTYGKGDNIIEIPMPKSRSKWADGNAHLPPKIVLRKIDCTSPDGKGYTLFTSVLDENIDKSDIQVLYLSRWDIEISIREIKTIMDINILRGKTPEMLQKELNVSLAAYNLIRKIIYASLKDLPFSPKEDFIYKFYTHHKVVLVDKKGRVYSKWSTGRKRDNATYQEANAIQAATGA